MTQKSESLEWGKLILPLIITLLVGSEGWQYYAAPDKIKEETSIHVDNLLVKNLHRKLDSISIAIAKKEFAAKSLEDAVAVIKNKNGREANQYLMEIFQVADEAIKNDSNWRHVQRPFIDWLYKNKNAIQFLVDNELLIPFRVKATQKLFFNSENGVFPITEKKHGATILRRWIDRSEDIHPLQSISTVKDSH